MADVSLSIDGLAHLERMTTPQRYDETVQTIVSKAAISGENFAKERSPVDKGRLVGAITHNIGQMTARYGVMGGGGTVGVYGLALDKPLTRNPHYRGKSPYVGSPTANWFSGTKEMTQQKVDQLLAEAVVKIESDWSGNG